MEIHKCNEKSNVLRAEGNKLYSERKFFDALIKYNESLCYSEPKTENIGLAFANKSAVYFEMKVYDKCISSIDQAKNNSYPEKNFEILNNREKKCQELKNSQVKTSPWSFFKLSYPANENNPQIIKCLEVRCNEKFGRHVITNQTLKVGDIISIEDPFCAVLLSESNLLKIPESNIYQRCSNCLKENALDLIPCESCCKAMFCSESCYSQALKRYHRYECPVMHQLIKSGSVHISLRLFFIALSTFDGSVEKLQAFLNDHKNENSTVFDVDFKSKDKNRKLFLCLTSLTNSSKEFPLHAQEEILKNHPILSEVWKNHQDFIKTLLLRQCQQNDLNFHGIFSGTSRKLSSQDQPKSLKNMQQPIGSSSMLFSSLVNHSCANNVLRISVQGKVVFVAFRPIAAGEQIFDCYKANFMNQQRVERQARLFQEFGFKCECEACSKNFPTPPALKFNDIKLLKYAKKADDEILMLPPAQGMKTYRECCSLIERNYQNFPCVELCMLQKCVATFLLSQTQPSILFP